MSFKKLAADLELKYNSRHNKHRPFLVALDGLGGAGKTVLAEKLDTGLKLKDKLIVIHLDDYIVKRANRYHTGKEEWYEYYFLQWDAAMIRENLLFQLHMSPSTITLPFYEKEKDQLKPKTIQIPDEAIIIMEGVFLQRPEWRVFYDVIIYLDCPKEIRHQRVLQRDSYLGDRQERLEKYTKRYWPAEDYYVKTIRPEQTADIVYSVK